MLVLPNSTAHVLRGRPSLSLFTHGLHHAGLSAVVNDTNTHVGQTVLAPTNAAFSRLSGEALRFLFSRGGTPYLAALLRFHIVQNHTMFSDVYFPHESQPMVPLLQGQPAAASSAEGLQITVSRAARSGQLLKNERGPAKLLMSMLILRDN